MKQAECAIVPPFFGVGGAVDAGDVPTSPPGGLLSRPNCDRRMCLRPGRASVFCTAHVASPEALESDRAERSPRRARSDAGVAYQTLLSKIITGCDGSSRTTGVM
jgi:hypothetical protein